MKHFTYIIFGIIFCLAASCGKYDNPLPTVIVDFPVYPNDAGYLDLNYYGGHMYFKGGVNGVVVYRLGEWEFCAFDRACPYDWDTFDEPRVYVEDNGIILQCEKCHTQYQILDGNVISGPSKYPLRRYRCSFDGITLRVRN